jgi:fructokinase
MTKPHLILGIGELLWDVLPNATRLGGAPANFAVMAGRLGNRAAILSRIGRDDLARQAIDRLTPMPVETSLLQVDPIHETGRVTVSIEGHEPHYTIHKPAAWDFLELSDEWIQNVERADAICFGSLAQRHPQSRQTIQTLVAEASASCIRVFDVNLRAPFYSSEVMQESLELASVVKMNEAELPLVLDLLNLNLLNLDERNIDLPNLDLLETTKDFKTGTADIGPQAGTERMRKAAEQLLSVFPELQMVVITRGARGSLLVTRDEWDEHRGFPIKVADAVGAGDAFTAAITHYMLRGADLATLNEAGNRWGGWLASQSGAMPALPDSVRDAIAAAIEKTAG